MLYSCYKASQRICTRDYQEQVQLAVRKGLELFATKVQVQRSCGHSTTLPVFEIVSKLQRILVQHSCFFRIRWSRDQRWNFAHFRNPNDERLRQLNIRGAIIVYSHSPLSVILRTPLITRLIPYPAP